MISQCTGQVVHAAIVDDGRHFFELVAIDRAGVVEVEAQLIGADVRALLTGALAEHVLERAVQQVRRGVVAARSIPQHGVDFGLRQLVDTDDTVFDASVVDDVAGRVELGVVHDEQAAGRAYPADVAFLAAALRVERRRLEHQPRLAPAPSSGTVLPSALRASTLAWLCVSVQARNSVWGRSPNSESPARCSCAERSIERARSRS